MMVFLRLILTTLVMVAVLTGLTGETAWAQKTTSLQGTCFGPIGWQVTVGQELGDSASQQLQQAVQTRLDEINQLMSTYQDDSDVTRFNRSDSIDWFPVDAETAAVIQRSRDISVWTDGAFDITVGPLVQLWNFGAGKQDGQDQILPTTEAIQKARQRVGYQKLEVRQDPPSIRKSQPDLQIDLSAIAKGYAVDQVARATEGLGYSNYFVEVGEEVRAAGEHPSGRPWVCGIEKPLEGFRRLDIRIPLNNAAIATSGDYRQFRMVDGKRLSHTIDPRTGEPVQTGVALASVQFKDCMTADALATAMMVLPWEESQVIANEHGAGVRVVRRTESAATQVLTNSLYPKPMPEAPAQGNRFLIPVGISLLAFGMVVLAMSVGVIFKRKPIQGSCGGLANMPGSTGSACDLCSNPSKECQEMGRGAKKAREEAEATSAPDSDQA